MLFPSTPVLTVMKGCIKTRKRMNEFRESYLDIFFGVQIAVGMRVSVVIAERKTANWTHSSLTFHQTASPLNKAELSRVHITSQTLPTSHRPVNSLLHSEAVEESGWNTQ